MARPLALNKINPTLLEPWALLMKAQEIFELIGLRVPIVQGAGSGCLAGLALEIDPAPDDSLFGIAIRESLKTHRHRKYCDQR